MNCVFFLETNEYIYDSVTPHIVIFFVYKLFTIFELFRYNCVMTYDFIAKTVRDGLASGEGKRIKSGFNVSYTHIRHICQCVPS